MLRSALSRWATLRALRRTARRVAWAARRAVGRSLATIQGAVDVDGVRVSILGHCVEESRARSRLAEALRFIRSSDSRRYRRVKDRIGHIVVWPADFTAYDALGGIHLAAELLERASLPYLASALVHEATHIRLDQMGISYSPGLRQRIEALCMAEQSAFLGALDSPAAAAAADDVRLASVNPSFSEKDHRDDFERNLTAAGISPRIRSLLWRFKNGL